MLCEVLEGSIGPSKWTYGIFIAVKEGGVPCVSGALGRSSKMAGWTININRMMGLLRPRQIKETATKGRIQVDERTNESVFDGRKKRTASLHRDHVGVF